MHRKLKETLKNCPSIVKLKRFIWARVFHSDTYGTTTHNVLLEFPAFAPFSAGGYDDRSKLTIQTINQSFPFLSKLCEHFSPQLEIIDVARFPQNDKQRQAVVDLKRHFDDEGSDKANSHNYHHLYGSILQDPLQVRGIFEVGLGTNNTDVVSNMGASGKPGASLRAFRNFCQSAIVHGADVDKRILFSEERIETFYIDQTNRKTFETVSAKGLPEYDLIIDDGLHSIDANIATLEFGLKKVAKGGWVVIEDIVRDAIPVWQVVASAIPSDHYKCHLFNADGAILFAVNRLI